MDDRPPDFDEVLHRAFRYALALTHDAGDAEDLVQDACLAVIRRGGPWRTPYLLSVIRNRFIDLCRRDRVLRFRPLEEPDEPSTLELKPHVMDEALDNALARLRPEERELLYLNAVEQYSTSEIARLTGRRRGTILSTLHRTKQKLRNILASQATRKIS